MQSRCPFSDCLHVFNLQEDCEFQILSCPGCARRITARTLARHLEIDKQAARHRAQASLASQYFQKSDAMEGKSLVVILEELRSLWNVGSIFRTADAAGFSHLFLVGITGCPPRKEIAKTSLGAEDHVDWSYASSSLEVINGLKKLGYQIIALEKTDKSESMTSALAREQLKLPLCLVLGSEVKGVYAETLDASDLVLDLPMRGFKESLNVAVAFGVAAYAMAGKLLDQG